MLMISEKWWDGIKEWIMEALINGIDSTTHNNYPARLLHIGQETIEVVYNVNNVPSATLVNAWVRKK